MPRLFILQSPPESVASPLPGPVVAIDANNNLTINGVPFLLIRTENVDYAAFNLAGYTVPQIDAKIAQMQMAGLNCMFGNWGSISANPPWQDQDLWNKFGIYWMGYATKDENGYTALGDPYSKMLPIINLHVNRLNLLIWAYFGEIDPGAHPTFPDTPSYDTYVVGGMQYVRNADQTRVVSSVYVTSGPGQTVWDQVVNRTGLQIPMVELAMGGSASIHAYVTLNHMYPWINLQNQRVLANLDGLGWIPSNSTTALVELTNPFVAPGIVQQLPTQDELNRFLWLQVAFNCRAFEILWGPNNRDKLITNQLSQASRIRFVSSGTDTRQVLVAGLISGVLAQETITLNGTTSVDTANTYDAGGYGSAVTSARDATQTITVTQTTGGMTIGTIGPLLAGLYARGDQGLPIGYLNVFNMTWITIGNINSLASVILAPGNWTQITTTPAFVPDDGTKFLGIYAAKKSAGGFLYVIAANTNEDSGSNEVAVNGATIDVGQTINTCIRVADESGSPSFAGSVITENFRTMQTYVYKIT